MFKKIFTVVVVSLHLVTFVYSIVELVLGLSVAAFGLAVTTIAPLLQKLAKADTLHVAHHKVRLPKTSLIVFVGLGLILVSVDKDSVLAWLAFVNVGAFLLDTYWLKDS